MKRREEKADLRKKIPFKMIKLEESLIFGWIHLRRKKEERYEIMKINTNIMPFVRVENSEGCSSPVCELRG